MRGSLRALAVAPPYGVKLVSRQDEGFWDFSLRTYRCRGVPEACLALQDGWGSDVNLVLFCCWAGARSAPLDDQVFDQALAFSRQWHAHVVLPLRSVRRWMKDAGCAVGPVDREVCLAVRSQVKSVELAAEKLQQMALAGLPLSAEGHGGGLMAVAANLRRYFAAIGITVDADVLLHVNTIVRAALPAPADSDFMEFDRQFERG